MLKSTAYAFLAFRCSGVINVYCKWCGQESHLNEVAKHYTHVHIYINILVLNSHFCGLQGTV